MNIMRFRFGLEILLLLIFCTGAAADDGCKLVDFSKTPVYDDAGKILGYRLWMQVKLKTPLQKETNLFVTPEDTDPYFDIWLTGGKVVKFGVTDVEAKAVLQGICPDLFADPRAKQGLTLLAPRATSSPRRFGQMSGNTVQADLNGDGITDSVAFLRNQVAVILYNADETTRPRTLYTAILNPLTLIAADFNGDGKLDLAVGGDSNRKDGNWLAILLGNGDGTFQDAKTMNAGNGVARLAAADLNGDGKMDIVAANPYSDKISVLLGNGDGTFAAPVAYAAPSYPSAMVSIDLNNDRRPDVAVLSRFGDMLGVFLSNADGTLKPALTMSAGGADHALAYTDINNDGRMDLVGVDFFGNALSVLLGNGDGTFQPGKRYLTATQSETVSLLPTRDGRTVVFTLDGNTGDVILEVAAADGTLSTPESLNGGAELSGIAIGDLDGDGKQDIVSTDSKGASVYVTLNAGGGPKAVSKTVKLAGAAAIAPAAVAIADLNGDRRGDLVLTSNLGSFAKGDVAVLLSGADGTPGAPQRYPVGIAPVAVATGDLNGDGKVDVVALCNGVFSPAGDPGNVTVFLGKGDGTLLPAVNLALVANQRPVSLAIADFDGDGRLDIAVASKAPPYLGPGKITIYPGKGDGTFSAGRDVPFADPANSPEFITAADLNGDGKMDLVGLLYVENPRWVVAPFLNRGSGVLVAGVVRDTDFGAITAVARDFNGDGKVDLVVAHCCGATDTTYLLGNGDGTFQNDVHLLSVPSPRALATADLDGDGVPELVMGGNRDISKGGILAVFSAAFSAPAPFVVVSAADSKVTAIAPGSLASAFGNGLALRPEGASSAALPTSLGGTSVQVRDSAQVTKAAVLSYASPSQVNFVVPEGLASGTATVIVQPENSGSISTTVNVATVAPAVFTLNAGGLAAALVLRVKGDGTRTTEPIYQVDSTGAVVAKPISLGPASEQVYVLLFGTGLRQGNGTRVRIGGFDAPVIYSGPQGEFPGLDQVNALVPRSLAGAGSVALDLTVSGVSAASTRITVQ